MRPRMISSITSEMRMYMARASWSRDVAEPRVRQVGLQHDAEQQHVEAPAEDAEQDRRGELVLAGARR